MCKIVLLFIIAFNIFGNRLEESKKFIRAKFLFYSNKISKSFEGKINFLRAFFFDFFISINLYYFVILADSLFWHRYCFLLVRNEITVINI